MWNGEGNFKMFWHSDFPHTIHQQAESTSLGNLSEMQILRTYFRLPEFKTLKLEPATAAAKSLQSCPTLGDPVDGNPPGSCVHGILQARVQEWVAISFSNALKWKVKVKSLSRVQLLATPRTAPYQAPASMGFSRQEYWSGLPLPSPKLEPSSLF